MPGTALLTCEKSAGESLDFANPNSVPAAPAARSGDAPISFESSLMSAGLAFAASAAKPAAPACAAATPALRARRANVAHTIAADRRFIDIVLLYPVGDTITAHARCQLGRREIVRKSVDPNSSATAGRDQPYGKSWRGDGNSAGSGGRCRRWRGKSGVAGQVGTVSFGCLATQSFASV